MYTDASVDILNNLAAISYVINHNTGVIIGSRPSIAYIRTDIVEADALHFGLKRALEVGIRRIIANIDSQQLYWNLLYPPQNMSQDLKLSLRRIRRIVRKFDRVRISLLPSSQNCRADSIAKEELNKIRRSLIDSE